MLDKGDLAVSYINAINLRVRQTVLCFWPLMTREKISAVTGVATC
jgi:hypothetical protein